MLNPPAPRLLWRTACRLHRQLNTTQPATPVSIPPIPERLWLHWLTAVRQWKLAQYRGWNHALRPLHRMWNLTIHSLRQQLEQSVLPPVEEAPHNALTDPRSIFVELQGLHAEFPEVRLDLRESQLTVVTEPICLEEIELGSFAITLPWKSIRDSNPWRMRALDPSPAGKDRAVTHPHVNGSHLCLGDGQQAVQLALRQGRLLDAFVLIRQILETYNSGSAYVRLEDWLGVECEACAALISVDDALTCDSCHQDLCYECSSSCSNCPANCCPNCRSSCEICRETVCTQCATTCDDCERSVCPVCVLDGLCDTCRADLDERTIDDDTYETDIPAPETLGEIAASAAVHSDGVGQAARSP